MSNNLVIISGITVSLLIVILLFKLNKTKIEYDNKLLVLNRKVRDLTNLVDLSNTKNSLLENGSANFPNKEQTPENSEALNTQIENQFQEFVTTNENFFNNLENYEAPIPEEVKENIDMLVNDDDMYSNLDSFSFEEKEVQNTQENEGLDNSTNEVNVENTSATQSDEVPQSSLDDEGEVSQSQSPDLGGVLNGVSMETEISLEEFDAANNFNSEEQFEVELNDSNTILMNDLENLDIEVDEPSQVLDNNLEHNQDDNTEDVTVTEVNVTEVNVVDNVLVDNSEANTSQNQVNFENLSNMSVKDLQEICRENKLKIKGRKDELIDRIKEYLSLSKL